MIRQQPLQPLELHPGAAHLRVDVIGIVSSAVLCGCGHGRLRGFKRKAEDLKKKACSGAPKRLTLVKWLVSDRIRNAPRVLILGAKMCIEIVISLITGKMLRSAPR